MKIHKEGYLPILVALVLLSLLVFVYFFCFTIPYLVINICFCLLIGILLFMIVRFFRVPRRIINKVKDGVLSPADGTIVAIEEVTEKEYFHDRRIQISIFMSAHNVHVNTYPIDGEIKYVAYHPGKYWIAKLPKSSELNENNAVVVAQDEHRQVLFRQIAGFIARRIVSYAQTGMTIKQGEEMGMIRFGSRVDVFLPLDTQVVVNIGSKVTSKKTVLAYF